jgi:hypothetical protein
MALGGLIPPIFAELRAESGDFTAKIQGAKGELASMEAEGSSSVQKLATVGGAAFAALGIAAVAVGVIGVKSAQDMEVAHTRLITTIKDQGQSWSVEQERVEAVDGKMQHLAFTHAETETSLSKLIPATHDTAKAVDLMGLAADIARGRHTDLAGATDILVKVETGRVSMLGRMGINVKDATGATISQEEAIKRLTATYGGQGQAYLGTFSGKIKQLQVNAEELAVTVGDMLIPVITTVGGAMADAAVYVSQNKTLIEGLGIAVSAVLVPAMAVWMGMKVVSFAESVGAAWLKLVNLIPGVVAGEEAKAVAAEQEAAAAAAAAVAQEALNAAEAESVAAAAEAAAATEALNAALTEQLVMIEADGVALDFGAGQLALFATESEATAGVVVASGEEAAAGWLMMLGPIGLGIAAVVGIGLALNSVFGGGGGIDEMFAKGRASGKAWADTQIKASADVADASSFLKGKLAEEKAIEHDVGEAYKAGTMSKDDAIQAYLHAQGASTELTSALKKEQQAHRETVAATQAVAAQYGISLPAAVAAGGKKMQDAIKLTEADFGDLYTHIEINAHLSAATMTALAHSTEQFAKSMDSSVSAATDPFTHKFADATSVSEGDMEAFFVGSQQQSVAWSAEIKKLIGEGVDQGIVQQMAKAGPDSLPSLDAFSQMVDEHGVDWVNSTAKAGQDAAAQTEQAFQQMVVSAAIHGAEQAAIVKATTADMLSGGSDHLLALYHNSDRSLAAMAYGALMKLGAVRQGVEGLPTTYTLTGTADVQAVLDAVHSVEGAMAGLTGEQAIALGRVFGMPGAHGLVGLAHGGSGQIVGPNRPVVIGEGLSREAVVPFDNYGDTVQTIRNSGAAGVFARAARDAGGGDGGGGIGHGGLTVHHHHHQTDVHVHGSVWGVRDLTDAVLEEMRAQLRTSGDLRITK